MADEFLDDEMKDIFYIPENAGIASGLIDDNIAGIALRNILEAIVFVFILWKGIALIPFVDSVRLIISIMICMLVGIVCLFGIKGESVTRFIRGYFNYYTRRCIYVVRPPIILLKRKKAITGEKIDGKKVG